MTTKTVPVTGHMRAKPQKSPAYIATHERLWNELVEAYMQDACAEMLQADWSAEFRETARAAA